MSEYLIQSETLTSIANAIRSKTGEIGEIKLTDFSTKIQNITSSGGGVGKLGGMLLAGENGTYYPNQSICFDTVYPFKASYTQEFLASLYEEASAVYEFPMNDFATGAPLIDNNDANMNGVVVIRFMLGANIYYYGLMKECPEPKFWVPVEVATALGYSTEGWYTPLDATGTNFVPSDIPDYPLMGSATFVIENEGIFELFDPSDFVGFSSVKVDMSTGGGAANLAPLVVTENGQYRPIKSFNPLSDQAYLMKTSYTQEYLSALYTKASALGTFPLNDFTTVASMINNHDGNALMVICFSLNGYTFYGLMIECNEPKFWVPTEVANALGQGSEGWYIPLDATGMNFAPSDTPKYPWVVAATAVISTEEISMLFAYDNFDGYSSVNVDVQSMLMQLNATENESVFAPKVATGTFTPSSTIEPITVEHNLGITPDVVILQIRYQFTESALQEAAGCMFVATGFSKAICDAVGIGQCIQTMLDDQRQLIYATAPTTHIETPASEYLSVPIHSATTTTITFGGGMCRLVTDGGGVAGDLYSWTAIGGLVPR